MNKSSKPWANELTQSWGRMARLAVKEAQDQIDKKRGLEKDIGDPNHPIYDGIFCYDREDFLKRQQK